MHEFSSSRQAGDLVVQITLCVLVAVVALVWAEELWRSTRRGRAPARVRHSRTRLAVGDRAGSLVAPVRGVRVRIRWPRALYRARQIRVDAAATDTELATVYAEYSAREINR